MAAMRVTESKLTSQGQVTVPAEIRARLGLAPGSVIAWEEVGGEVVVRRAARHSSLEIHGVLFAEPPAARPTSAFDEGIRERMRRRHARG